MQKIATLRRLKSVVILVASGTFLAGCASSNLPRTVAGGECRVFAAPDYAIRGKYRSDQIWIDDTEEAGIAACGWPRPRARLPVKAPPKVIRAAAPLPPIVATPVVAPPPPQSRMKKLNNRIRRLRGAEPK